MVTKHLRSIKVKIPESLLQDLDLLVKAGIYANRNDAIRDAIRENLKP